MQTAKQQTGIAVFTHAPRTGGVTMNYLLRRHFGRHHLHAIYRGAVAMIEGRPMGYYTPADLRTDLRLPGHGTVRSMAGDGLRAFVDFGELDDRLYWFTMLREPVARCLSHYQYLVQTKGYGGSFKEWIENRGHPNVYVDMLAGKPDLEAAKAALTTRLACVGILERYKESLLLIRERLGLYGWRVAYERPKNAAPQDNLRQEIRDNFDRYEALLHRRCELDIQLYQYAIDTVWPQQVEAYGEARLEQDVETEFADTRQSPRETWNLAVSFLYRNLCYRPFVLLARKRKSPPAG